MSITDCKLIALPTTMKNRNVSLKIMLDNSERPTKYSKAIKP